MDFERLFFITNNLRVLVRNTEAKSYVAIKSEGATILVDSNK